MFHQRSQILIPRRVNQAVVCVRLHRSEDFQVIHRIGRHQDAFSVSVKVGFFQIIVQSAKHRAVIHMVAVEQIVVVREAGAVPGGQIDRTGQAAVSADVMGGVVEIVFTLHDRIVDMRIIDRQPGPIVFIQGCQGISAGQRHAAVFDDLGPEVQDLSRTGEGLALHVKTVIEHIAAVQDQERSEQAGNCGHHLAACFCHTADYFIPCHLCAPPFL